MTTTAISAPISAPISAATVELLDRSRAGLLTATTAERAGERYIAAHLSALRAAAAVLATRGRAAGSKSSRSGGPTTSCGRPRPSSSSSSPPSASTWATG
jgi:SAV_6107-like HEPN